MILALVLILGSALREPAPSPPYVLTSALRSRLKTEALAPVSRVEDLPPAVKEALRVLFKADSLEMAEPNQEFQSTDVVLGPPIGSGKPLPSRRLDLAGVGKDLCLVHYERGGVAHSYNVVLLTLAGGTARFAWGGTVKGRMADLDALETAIFKGEVATTVSYW